MSTDRPPLFPGKRVPGERNLVYAALHPFPLPGWQPAEMVRLKGNNWQVIFKPDGADYIQMERGGHIVDRHLDGPNVLIGGVDGLSDAAEVTETQKPLVDAIRGLLLLGGPPGAPLLLPAIWEGVLKKSSPDTITFEVRRRDATALDVTVAKLQGWHTQWRTFDPLSSPREVGFGLRWFYKGMMELPDASAGRVDSFISLWLCVITLVRAWHAQTIGGDPSEMARFIAYAEQRLQLSGSALEEAKKQFQDLRDRRNELFKGGGGMTVSEAEASTAAELAHRILDHEITVHTRN